MRTINVQAPLEIPLKDTLACVLSGTIISFGILSNVGTLSLTLWETKIRKCGASYFILSLCASNLLLLVFCGFSFFFELYNHGIWVLGEVMCKL